MTIRRLTAADIPQLERLYRAYWNEASDIEKMRAKFVQLESNDAYALLCAEEGGRLLGSVMGIVCEELYGDCRPFLLAENMVVDASARRKGVGRALFEAIEAWGREKGCRQVVLATESDRADAKAFYTAIGFDPGANIGFKRKL